MCAVGMLCAFCSMHNSITSCFSFLCVSGTTFHNVDKLHVLVAPLLDQCVRWLTIFVWYICISTFFSLLCMLLHVHLFPPSIVDCHLDSRAPFLNVPVDVRGTIILAFVCCASCVVASCYLLIFLSWGWSVLCTAASFQQIFYWRSYLMKIIILGVVK